MKKIRKYFLSLVEWLKPSYKSKYINERPVQLKRRVVYVIGIQNKEWLLAFKCPCGCCQDIQLNLLKDAQPCWSYRISEDGKIDVRPSIRKKYGCKSHFTIHNGKVKWHS
jgi:hypothetical protein